MGYYAHTTDTHFHIPKEKFDEAYKAACALNWRNDLKSGGSYGGDTPEVIPEGPNPYRWFGWVDWNYHETCKDLIAVLKEFGFDPTFDEEGNISDLSYYDEKISGGEEELLRAIAHCVQEGSYLCWRGEDDYLFRYDFADSDMYERTGRLVEQWDE